jgi:uncharacterized protein YerC
MHISQKKLSRKEEDDLLGNFFGFLKSFHRKKQIEIFCREFFTRTELLTFTKRLNIMILLEQGMGYKEIREKVKVSSASIASVKKILKEKKLKKIVDSHKGTKIAIKQKLWNFFYT